MNRYLLSTALAVLLGIVCPVSSRAATILILPAGGHTVGQTVTVEVDLSLAAGESVTAFQLDIVFPAFLRADSATELGPFASGGCCFSSGTIDNTALKITSIFDGLAGPVSVGSSTTPLVIPLLRLSFTALNLGVGVIGVDPSTAQLIDPGYNNLAVTVADGGVTITGLTGGAQTITFNALSNVAFGSGNVTLTATASSGLAVSFASTTPPVCTVAGNIVTLVSAGACSTTASQAGNGNYVVAPNVVQGFTVTTGVQAITFNAPGNVAFGSGNVTLTAAASSGLAVSYASTTTPVCTVAGNVVTLVSAGACWITASQAGNGNYAVAPNVAQGFTVTAGAATLTVGNHIGTTGQTVEIPIQLTSTGTSGPVGIQLDLSFDATKLTFTSARIGGQSTSSGKSLSQSTLGNGNEHLQIPGFNQNTISNGVVAYATFTLGPQFTSGTSLIKPLNCSATDGLGNPLAAPCVAGTIRIVTCDVNADGNTNVVDVQLTIDEALALTPAVHDLNGDGVVTVLDVQIVINAALGLGCVP